MLIPTVNLYVRKQIQYNSLFDLMNLREFCCNERSDRRNPLEENCAAIDEEDKRPNLLWLSYLQLLTVELVEELVREDLHEHI